MVECRMTRDRGGELSSLSLLLTEGALGLRGGRRRKLEYVSVGFNHFGRGELNRRCNYMRMYLNSRTILLGVVDACAEENLRVRWQMRDLKKEKYSKFGKMVRLGGWTLSEQSKRNKLQGFFRGISSRFRCKEGRTNRRWSCIQERHSACCSQY